MRRDPVLLLHNFIQWNDSFVRSLHRYDSKKNSISTVLVIYNQLLKREKLHAKVWLLYSAQRRGDDAEKNAGGKHQELAGYLYLYDSDFFKWENIYAKDFFILAIHCGLNWEEKVQFSDRKRKLILAFLSNQTVIKNKNIY